MIRPLLPVFALVFAMSHSTFAADVQDLYQARTFKAEAGQLPYRLLKPRDYEPTKKYPLVIFLHGAGERGDDNAKQLVHGLKDFASDTNRAKYPCFVVAPQCPNNKQWVEVPWSGDKHTMPKEPSTPLALSVALLDGLEKEFSIDPQRVYVTGLSMGGFGTWDLVQRYPNRFAAAAPVCGGGDTAEAQKIAKLPIWVFHGDRDSVVKTQRSRDMVAALQSAGGSPKYTEYPNTEHNSWTATYSDPKFMEWLFGQQKAD